MCIVTRERVSMLLLLCVPQFTTFCVWLKGKHNVETMFFRKLTKAVQQVRGFYNGIILPSFVIS